MRIDICAEAGSGGSEPAAICVNPPKRYFFGQKKMGSPKRVIFWGMFFIFWFPPSGEGVFHLDGGPLLWEGALFGGSAFWALPDSEWLPTGQWRGTILSDPEGARSAHSGLRAVPVRENFPCPARQGSGWRSPLFIDTQLFVCHFLCKLKLFTTTFSKFEWILFGGIWTNQKKRIQSFFTAASVSHHIMWLQFLILARSIRPVFRLFNQVPSDFLSIMSPLFLHGSMHVRRIGASMFCEFFSFQMFHHFEMAFCILSGIEYVYVFMWNSSIGCDFHRFWPFVCFQKWNTVVHWLL